MLRFLTCLFELRPGLFVSFPNGANEVYELWTHASESGGDRDNRNRLLKAFNGHILPDDACHFLTVYIGLDAELKEDLLHIKSSSRKDQVVHGVLSLVVCIDSALVHKLCSITGTALQARAGAQTFFTKMGIREGCVSLV